MTKAQTYEHLKRQWLILNPKATAEQYERAMQDMARRFAPVAQ